MGFEIIRVKPPRPKEQHEFRIIKKTEPRPAPPKRKEPGKCPFCLTSQVFTPSGGRYTCEVCNTVFDRAGKILKYPAGY